MGFICEGVSAYCFFETLLAIPGIFEDYRCNEGLVGALHHSGVAAMALRYSQTPSQTPKMSLDVYVQAIKL